MECTKNSNTTKSESVPNPTFTEDSYCCYPADCATDNIWCSGTAPTPVIIASPDLSCFYYTPIADAATALTTAATAESWLIAASCPNSITATTRTEIRSAI